MRNWCKQVSARDGSSRSTSLFVLSVTVQPVSGFHRESTPSEHENRTESFQVDHCSQMFSSVNAVMRSLTSIRAAMVGVFPLYEDEYGRILAGGGHKRWTTGWDDRGITWTADSRDISDFYEDEDGTPDYSKLTIKLSHEAVNNSPNDLLEAVRSSRAVRDAAEQVFERLGYADQDAYGNGGPEFMRRHRAFYGWAPAVRLPPVRRPMLSIDELQRRATVTLQAHYAPPPPPAADGTDSSSDESSLASSDSSSDEEA